MLDANGGPGTPPAAPPTPPPAPLSLDDAVAGARAALRAGQKFSDEDLDAWAKQATGGKYAGRDVGSALLASIQNDVHAAAAAGQKFSPADLEAWTRSETAGRYGAADIFPNTPRDMLRSIVQGATGGFGDEIAGQLFGNKTKQDMRTNDAVFHAAHPVIDMASRALPLIGGGALAGGGEAAAEGAGVASRVLGGAAKAIPAAATVGGVTAAGDSNAPTLAGRAAAAVPGAVVGGVGGGLLGALGGGVNAALASRAAKAAATAAGPDLAPALDQPLVREGLSKAAASSGGPDALRAVLDDIVKSGRGPQATISDLSPQMRAFADNAATLSPDVHSVLQELTTARQAGQSTRLLGDVRSNLGEEPSLAGIQNDLKESRQAWAAGPEGYGRLHADETPVNIDTFKAALNKPVIKTAWETAQRADEIKPGSPLDHLWQHLSGKRASDLPDNATSDELRQFVGDGTGAPTFNTVQSFRQELDDRISAAFNAGKGGLAKALKTVRGAVTDALGDQFEGFSAVDKEYAQRVGWERALEAGAKAFNSDDVTGIQQEMAKLPADAQDFYRRGMAAKLAEQLAGSQTNRDVAKRLLEGGPADQFKIDAIFGPKAAEFRGALAAERTMAQLRGATGGSPTAPRMFAAAQSAPGGLTAGDVVRAAVFPKYGFARMAAKAAANKLGQSAAQAVQTQATAALPLLTTQGPDAIMRLLASLQQGQAASIPTQALAAGAGSASAGLLPH